MRARLSTVGVLAVVATVAAAAAVDALTGGGSGSEKVAPRTAPPHRRAALAGPAAAPDPVPAAGTILFGGRIRGGRIPARALVAVPAAPGPQTVDVGIRPPRSGGGHIRVIAERLRLGPGVGTPSGERIAVWAWNPARPALDGIYSRDAAGGALERLTAAHGHLQQPLAFSPDGARLLYYESGRDRRPGWLAVVSAGGTGRARVTPPGETSWCCTLGAPGSWGPDGRVAFAAFASGAAGRRGRSAVYVAGADGSHLRRITPATAWATAARWSPDGRWIAFDQADRARGAHDLFLVRPDGTGLHVVATAGDGAGACCARWSANSGSLLYAAGPSGRAPRPWTVRIDGSGIRAISRGGA